MVIIVSAFLAALAGSKLDDVAIFTEVYKSVFCQTNSSSILFSYWLSNGRFVLKHLNLVASNDTSEQA